MDAFAVIALAARTSLGPLAAAAAAARAGMSNGRELDFAAMGLAGEAPPGAIGHGVSEIAPPLTGLPRLLALATPAAADLRAVLVEKSLGLGRTGLYVAMPRPVAGTTLDGSAFFSAVRSALGVGPIEERVLLEGPAGAAHAIREATQALEAGRVDHAIVGGCDSRLDPACVSAALADGRLKTEEYPVGFMPGEAAAWMLLETKALADERPTPPEALLFGPFFAVEEPAEPNVPPTGKGLAAAAVSALHGAAAAHDAGTAWLDLDGSPRRATDWGMAVVRARRHAPLDEFHTEMPAVSFGTVGAAFPVLGIALATRAFVRGYAKGPVALICTSSDDGARAAMVVRASDR